MYISGYLTHIHNEAEKILKLSIDAMNTTNKLVHYATKIIYFPPEVKITIQIDGSNLIIS